MIYPHRSPPEALLTPLSIYRALLAAIRLLPYPLRIRLADRAGYPWALFSDRRRVFTHHLLPLTGSEAYRLAPVALGQFLQTACDFFCPPTSWKNRIETVGIDKLDEAYRRYGRLILLTAHVGHWELAAHVAVERGYPFAALYQPFKDPMITRWILRARDPRVEWIPVDGSAFATCRKALAKGKILGIVADVPFGEKGSRLPFLGRDVMFPRGPMLLAAETGTPMLPAFLVRQRPGYYRTVFGPLLAPQERTPQEIQRLQRAFVQELEEILRQFPTQWGLLEPFFQMDVSQNCLPLSRGKVRMGG